MNRIFTSIAASLFFLGGASIPSPAKSCLPVPFTPGPFKVSCDTFKSPDWNETFYMFHPDPDTASPLLLLCPAFNVEGPHEYFELIEHLAGRGNHVLFVPVRKSTLTRNKIRAYDLGEKGIIAAVQRWPGIDTARIGVIGHGFGGGAVPALTRALRLRGWGDRGTFMYIMSPWYLYSIDERLMAAFPEKVNLVVQTFADDRLNDPKIAIDIFSIIGIPADRKLYLTTNGIETGGCRIRADFTTPFGDQSVTDEWNMLDLQAICRPIDATLRRTFADEPDSFAKRVERDIAPDDKTPVNFKSVLAVVDTPASHLPRGIWVNQWGSPRNPRNDANIIRKARKTYFRGEIKKMEQLANLTVETVRTRKESFVSDEEANPIGSGFGSDGLYDVHTERFAHPSTKGDTVSFFCPDDSGGPFPVIFFLHGYNNGNPDFY